MHSHKHKNLVVAKRNSCYVAHTSQIFTHLRFHFGPFLQLAKSFCLAVGFKFMRSINFNIYLPAKTLTTHVCRINWLFRKVTY